LYPPEQDPENYYEDAEYEYEEVGPAGNKTLLQTSLAFVAGGCAVFLCMSLCGLLLGAVWLLDSSSTVAAVEGSEVGVTFEEPAFPTEAVVNEQQMQLTILEVNRDAALEAIPPVEGTETIIVTIELVNLGAEEAVFDERDFILVNEVEEMYEPALGAISRRDGALGRGTLPPNEGLEGRLVFQVLAGEPDLRLVWQPSGRDVEPRYIYLE
jgi:hypothetical protein